MELAVPDPRTEIVPRGWCEEIAVPVIDVSDWDGLDEIEARLKAAASFIDSFEGDTLEFEKALRFVDMRRGVLLGPTEQGHRTDLDGGELVPRVVQVDVAKQTATRYRKVADNWEDLLRDKVLAATNRKHVTQAAVLRAVTEHTTAVPSADVADVLDGQVTLMHGDFRERLSELPDGSVDLILTDPPYPKDDLHLYGELAETAARLLGPRGLLIAYAGNFFIPQIIEMMSEHLTYGWTFCHLMETGSRSRIMGRHIMQSWKPCFAFSQGTWPSAAWVDSDVVVSPKAEKDDYEWQQSIGPAEWFIENYSPPTGLVVDPFLGVGTFGAAAVGMGRRFVGVELDAGRFEKASERIGQVAQQ